MFVLAHAAPGSNSLKSLPRRRSLVFILKGVRPSYFSASCERWNITLDPHQRTIEQLISLHHTGISYSQYGFPIRW